MVVIVKIVATIIICNDRLSPKGSAKDIPTKPNGGMDADDFISSHAQKHLYDPSKTSTPNKSQYSKDVHVDY